MADIGKWVKKVGKFFNKDRKEANKSKDLIFLMDIIEKVNEKWVLDGITKLQKLVFLTEYFNQYQRGEKIFDYKFYKWNYGPYSPQINNSISFLQERGILTEDEGIKITERGKKILNNLEIPGKVGSKLQKVVEKFGEKPLEQIKNEVYDLKVKGKKIKDYEKKKNNFIFEEEKNKECVIKEKEREAWLRTFRILINRRLMKELREAEKQAKRGELVHVKELELQ